MVLVVDVNRPIVQGPMATVKTCQVVETVLLTVNRPNCSRYEGLQIVVFILIDVAFITS